MMLGIFVKKMLGREFCRFRCGIWGFFWDRFFVGFCEDEDEEEGGDGEEWRREEMR